MSSYRLLFPLVLLAFLAAPLCGDEMPKPPNLNEADSIERIKQYLYYEQIKANKQGKKYGSSEFYAAMVPVHTAAYKKAMEIAKTYFDKMEAYEINFSALDYLEKTGDENAENEIETFLKELSETSGFANFADKLRLQRFISKAKGTVKTQDDFNAFKAELMPWIKTSWFHHFRDDCFSIAMQCKYSVQRFGEELKTFIQSDACTLSAESKKRMITDVDSTVIEYMYYEFEVKAYETVNTPESFALFKTELKTWFNKFYPYPIRVMNHGISIAENNNVPPQEIAGEMIAFILSPDCTIPKSEKPRIVKMIEGIVRLSLGSDPKLYGKTIDDEDFQWESLRGKYVLIAFTRTGDSFRKENHLDMLEAYKKYHDKGLEIISVYVWQTVGDPVADVKKEVAEDKLPWIILSESLTIGVPDVKYPAIYVYEALSKFLMTAVPKQSDYYGIHDIPTMVITDKEGKIIMTYAEGVNLKTKLAEIFE